MVNGFKPLRKGEQDLIEGKSLQPNTIWLQIHWLCIQTTEMRPTKHHWTACSISNKMVSPFKPLRKGEQELIEGKSLQPNTIWLQIHWLCIQTTERRLQNITEQLAASAIKWSVPSNHSGKVNRTSLKVKVFNPTPFDYKSTDFVYKLLKWDHKNITKHHRKACSISNKMVSPFKPLRKGQQDLIEGKGMHPNTIWLPFHWPALQITEGR
jgi:hypothetical protein